MYFTDEVHFKAADLTYKIQYELRQPGKSIVDQLHLTIKASLDLTVHVADGVSYNQKGPLSFYSDPKEPGPKVYKPGKPRRSSVEAWQSKPEHEVVVQWKDNSMMQEFYAQSILPGHIKHIKWL